MLNACPGVDILTQLPENELRFLYEGCIIDDEPPGQTWLALEKNILCDGERRYETEFLKYHRNAEMFGNRGRINIDCFAFKQDGAGVLRINASQYLHERRLAGAISAHERMNLALTQVEISFLQYRNTVEAFFDGAHLQKKCFLHFDLVQFHFFPQGQSSGPDGPNDPVPLIFSVRLPGWQATRCGRWSCTKQSDWSA